MEATKIFVQELKFVNGRRKDESLFMKPLLGGALPSTATLHTLNGGKLAKLSFNFWIGLSFKQNPHVKKVTFYRIFISVINQLDAQHFCFTISLFHASTCFEHMCSSSGGQNCITQPLVSSHL